MVSKRPIIQKIIELSSKDWMSGVSVSGQMPGSGLFAEASGINPFVNAFSSSYQTGLLQTSAAPTEIQSSVVVDEIIAGAFRGSSYKAYFLGDEGHLYDMDTSSYSTPTDLRSGTPITTPADGLEIFTPVGGSAKLYYWQRTQIGTWDLSGSYPTGWTENSYTGLTSSDIHPTHQFLGKIFFGDKNYISTLYDNGAGAVAKSLGELDIPADFTITTIDDDGFYLVFGATTNTISGNLQVNTLNKIFFWDTYSNSWQKEYTLPVAGIGSIRRIGSMLYALTTDGIYAFNFSLPPQLVLPLANADALPLTPGVVPTNRLMAVKNETLYWLSGAPDVCAYGSPVPGFSPRFYRPFKAVGTIPTYIAYPDKFLMIVAGATDKLGTISTVASGATSRSAETVYIPLGRKWDIKRIEIITGEPLASGDELNIDLQSDEDTSASDYGTFSFAAQGAKRTRLLTGSFHAENLKIIFNFVGGNVKIKKVNVYAEPVTI